MWGGWIGCSRGGRRAVRRPRPAVSGARCSVLVARCSLLGARCSVLGRSAGMRCIGVACIVFLLEKVKHRVMRIVQCFTGTGLLGARCSVLGACILATTRGLRLAVCRSCGVGRGGGEGPPREGWWCGCGCAYSRLHSLAVAVHVVFLLPVLNVCVAVLVSRACTAFAGSRSAPRSCRVRASGVAHQNR